MWPEDQRLLEPWAELWWRYLGGIFLASYLRHLGSRLQHEERMELETLLNLFLLDRAVRDLSTSLDKGASPAVPLQVLKSIISAWRSRAEPAPAA
jgi:maltose alpha-D-glucosyltransferase/alpha-amylase